MGTNVVIPMSDSASFTESVTLDGIEYRLAFAWNSRGAFWTMSISDANGVLLRAGIRLVTMFPLTEQHPGLNMPQGEFIVYDANAATQKTEPGRYDFVSGRNLKLMYWSRQS